jgi:ribonuclease BN (tRNA processing enzyme)
MIQNSFTVLGSSSGLPQAGRACSGYLLQSGESLSLIDCGGGVTASFLRCGFDPLKLDRIFVSHTHSDHCGELTLVIQMLHVMRAGRLLEIFVPDEFVRPFLAYLNAVYLFPQHVSPQLRIHGYADGFHYHGPGFDLTAIANQHLGKAAEIIEQYDIPNRMQCHSFMIQTEASSLLYSADIADFGELEPLLGGLDFALVESTHIDLEQLLEYARTASSEQFILTHLGGEADVRTLEERLKAAPVSNVTLAYDGLRLEL